jgi:hypothetical protein
MRIWISELLSFRTLPIIRYCKKQTFRKMNLFPSTSERVGEIYSVG